MGADYSFYVKTIETHACTFLPLNISAIGTVVNYVFELYFCIFLQYVGEGARMVRELFEMARTKKACLIFFDEIDAVGGARFDDGAGGDNEVQRTMLELINQLDGFDPRGNIKVLMATNRPDTLGMLKDF